MTLQDEIDAAQMMKSIRFVYENDIKAVIVLIKHKKN